MTNLTDKIIKEFKTAFPLHDSCDMADEGKCDCGLDEFLRQALAQVEKATILLTINNYNEITDEWRRYNGGEQTFREFFHAALKNKTQ